MFEVGFIDPTIINEKMLLDHPEDVEADLTTFLIKQAECSEILFPYGFKWVFPSCTNFYLTFLDVKRNIDELCMSATSAVATGFC